MTISLSKDVEEFLQEQVRTGTCSDASEFVNDLLRSVREQKKSPFTITPELEEWLLEAAEEPFQPLTRADFDSIRTRARERKTPSKA